MTVSLIQVPYVLGDERQGASKGPGRLVEAGADKVVAAKGVAVRVERVDRGGPFRDSGKASLKGARPYDQNFVPAMSQLLIGVLKETTFPQRPKSMQRFIADSAAALGDVTARRSRDICAQERLARKRAHRILRYEFFIECSCGYQGHSRNHSCPDCGTKIVFPVTLGSTFV